MIKVHYTRKNNNNNNKTHFYCHKNIAIYTLNKKKIQLRRAETVNYETK